MRKDSRKQPDEMKAEYTRADLGPLVRGKYTERLRESSNIVVIDPDVHKAFPNARADLIAGGQPHYWFILACE